MIARAFENGEAKREFLRSVEQSLRDGNAEDAARAVQDKMAIVAKANEAISQLALSSTAEKISIKGWEELSGFIDRNSSPDRPITGLSIDLSYAGWDSNYADVEGMAEPYLEISVYSDNSFAFSQTSRADLLNNFDDNAANWVGCFEDIDSFLKVEGLAQLYGAVEQAAKLRNEDTAQGDAYVLGACMCAILVHQAVRQTINNEGLPCPLTVIVGSNEEYPFFDAPVWFFEDHAPITKSPPNSPTSQSQFSREAGHFERRPNRLRQSIKMQPEAITDENPPGIVSKLISIFATKR